MSENAGVIDLEELLRAANPLGAAAAATLPVGESQRELCDALLATTSTSPEPPASRRRPVGSLRLAISLGVVLVGVVVGLSAGGVFAGGSGTAWGAELVRFANASPLVLLEHPGWRIDYADENSPQEGELHFTTGSVPSSPTTEDFTSQAGLFWRVGPLSRWMADRANEADLTTTAPVLGIEAHVYGYPDGQPGDRSFDALWDYDGRVLELQAGAPDIAAFESLLASLVRVDVNTWLSALPPSTVRTEDRGAVIASMLKGVTLPPGFDASTITGADLTSDRYQLGATVAGTVACTWFKLWSQARSAGDSAGVQQAIHAMATAKDWPILQEMSNSGAYPQILETFAAHMPSGTWSGRPLEGDVNSGLGCPALGVPLTVPGSSTGGATGLAPVVPPSG